MTRTPLPDRRPNVTVETAWSGHPITVTVGYDLKGRPMEVFANTRSGGDMAATLADACVLVSIALQHGIPAAALSKSLGRVPDVFSGGGAMVPASPVGAILEGVQAVQPDA